MSARRVTAVTPNLLEEVVLGVTPAVLIEAAVGSPSAKQGADWMTAATRYDAGTYPQHAYTIGPTLNQAKHNPSGWQFYSAAKDTAKRTLLALPELLALREQCNARIATWFGDEAEPLSTPVGPAFCGVVRRIDDGALPHWDNLNREWPDDLFPRLRWQVALNFFLAADGQSGSLLTWGNTARSVSTASPFVPRPAAPPTVITPPAGSAILFDPRNVHAVEPIREGVRITVSFFIGKALDNDKMYVWS